MSEVKTITNTGIIVQMDLPNGFYPAPDLDNAPNNYLEYQARGSMAMICYEQTDESLSTDSILVLEKLLTEDLADKEFRTLNISGDPAKGQDDSTAFDALSLCFVFGGFLTRDGTMMDMDKCTWELRSLKSASNCLTSIVGRMKFVDYTGRRSQRQVLLVLPQAPNENGCGYLWLEGNSSEVKRYERAFSSAIADAKIRELS